VLGTSTYFIYVSVPALRAPCASSRADIYSALSKKGKRFIKMSEELIEQVKQLIIDSLRIEGMDISGIDTDAPLFGEGLGLDSIDALQLVVGMEKAYGVVVPDAETGNKVFRSVRTMAEYIAEHRK